MSLFYFLIQLQQNWKPLTTRQANWQKTIIPYFCIPIKVWIDFGRLCDNLFADTAGVRTHPYRLRSPTHPHFHTQSAGVRRKSYSFGWKKTFSSFSPKHTNTARTGKTQRLCRALLCVREIPKNTLYAALQTNPKSQGVSHAVLWMTTCKSDFAFGRHFLGNRYVCVCVCGGALGALKHLICCLRAWCNEVDSHRSDTKTPLVILRRIGFLCVSHFDRILENIPNRHVVGLGELLGFTYYMHYTQLCLGRTKKCHSGASGFGVLCICCWLLFIRGALDKRMDIWHGIMVCIGFTAVCDSCWWSCAQWLDDAFMCAW